jgi:hypothetical protein
MMKHNLPTWMTRSVLVIILVAPFSCSDKKIAREITIQNGTYKGQFIRSSPLARYAPSNVTITFAGDRFSGKSDKPNYPAICEGTFKASKNTIEFTDECSWTADFDWSYILKGTFDFQLKDRKLEMTRTIGDNTDHYSLQLE